MLLTLFQLIKFDGFNVITLVEFEVIIAFGERKPILDLELSRAGYPVHGYMH